LAGALLKSRYPVYDLYTKPRRIERRVLVRAIDMALDKWAITSLFHGPSHFRRVSEAFPDTLMTPWRN
jgi:hypothetical protein